MHICFHSTIPLLGIYPIDLLAHEQNDKSTWSFVTALFEQPKLGNSPHVHQEVCLCDGAQEHCYAAIKLLSRFPYMNRENP